LKKPQAVRVVVAVGIVNHGEAKTALGGEDERFHGLGNDVAWTHPVDVVGALALKVKVDFRKLAGACHASPLFPLLAYLDVLAVEAFKVAVGEEDSAGAALAADARLFSVVKAI